MSQPPPTPRRRTSAHFPPPPSNLAHPYHSPLPNIPTQTVHPKGYMAGRAPDSHWQIHPWRFSPQLVWLSFCKRETQKNRWLQPSLSHSTIPFPRALERWILACRLLEFVKAKKILVLEVKESAAPELGWGFPIPTFGSHKIPRAEFPGSEAGSPKVLDFWGLEHSRGYLGGCKPQPSQENAIPIIISQTWLSKGELSPKKIN